ncbi:hypothetical protein FRB90_005531 [Tulasnella sp. 427]|nr:hypothetical protein FRB90_005531 [Tulasnella sp. 427]
MAISKAANPNISVQVLLRPTLPSQYDKYSGPLGGQGSVHLKSKIPPLSLDSTRRTSVSDLGLGWQDYLHPDGNYYYWNKDIKVATYNNPLQENVDTFIRTAKTRVEELARTQNADIASAESYFLVTAVRGNTAEIDYYMIDHDGGIPFWVEEANIEDTLRDLELHESEDHLRE